MTSTDYKSVLVNVHHGHAPTQRKFQNRSFSERVLVARKAAAFALQKSVPKCLESLAEAALWQITNRRGVKQQCRKGDVVLTGPFASFSDVPKRLFEMHKLLNWRAANPRFKRDRICNATADVLFDLNRSATLHILRSIRHMSP